MATGAVSPYLDPANWHADDAHVHSYHSGLFVTEVGKPIVERLKEKSLLFWLLNPFLKSLLRNRWDGQGEPVKIAEEALKSDLSWVLITEHGPNMGLPPLNGGGQCLYEYSVQAGIDTWTREQGELATCESAQGCCMIMGEEFSNLWRHGHLLVYGSQDYINNDPRSDLFAEFLGELIGIKETSFRKKVTAEWLEEQNNYLKE